MKLPAKTHSAVRSPAAVRLGPVGLTRSWGLLYSETRHLPAAIRALVSLFAEALPPLFARAA